VASVRNETAVADVVSAEPDRKSTSTPLRRGTSQKSSSGGLAAPTIGEAAATTPPRPLGLLARHLSEASANNSPPVETSSGIANRTRRLSRTKAKALTPRKVGFCSFSLTVVQLQRFSELEKAQ
jgi:hypothetical protein